MKKVISQARHHTLTPAQRVHELLLIGVCVLMCVGFFVKIVIL
ncbi:MAG: hypothetical protein SF053_02695 [Bacteroidia bacterium]|nr:hypothetical protein [Bacteroidia bacterium]